MFPIHILHMIGFRKHSLTREHEDSELRMVFWKRLRRFAGIANWYGSGFCREDDIEVNYRQFAMGLKRRLSDQR